MSNLNIQIERFLPVINKFPQFGSIQVSDHDEVGETFGELRPDDVVIYCDFMDDNCESDDQRDQLVTWYCDELTSELIALMGRFGYAFSADSDGSGGGLYYGAMLFRKVK